MSKPEDDKTRWQEERDRIEGLYTAHRIFELELDPVRGSFDVFHLREINRRIFQDLPGAGYNDVTPGEYRPTVADGKDWMKHRGLETAAGAFFVAYSRMDAKAQQRLDKALEVASPEQLRQLDTHAFTAAMATLYAELDYVHPFSDGNSRTLRTFTRQLANASGYELEWERFGRESGGRDALYVARDLAVNQLAKPDIQHENTMRKIVLSMDRLGSSRDLKSLLNDVIRPSRAKAFERLTEVGAIERYPELHEAYATLHKASAYFAEKMPGKADAQQQVVKAVREHIQKRLNESAVRGFGAEKDMPRSVIKTAHDREDH